MKIDIENIIKTKKPSLYKILPNFIINWIKKTLHQEEMNEIIERNQHLKGLAFNNAIVREFDIKIKIIGEENIPQEGKYIFAANHPLGGLDGIAMIRLVSDFHPKLRFIVNDILLNIENFSPIFVPVNKHGKQSRENIKLINEIFDSDLQILYFPAGICSRKRKGEILDLPWQKTFISKAIEYQRDIIPMFIDGKNSNRFYNLCKFRTALGLPNIEMFYLADEMFRQKGKTLTFVIGEPIKWQDISSYTKSDYPKVAETIKQKTYLLSTQIH
ncbi:1-acyl-sn-glycerol-3-phosphate acyltransferase [Patescibacteria group bacterium]|nr:1-acyl-sn-glycerol-3-phosphate acyltransferase [Patescibacteria group bacterium]MBU1759000.1 1-acyl-sn-glycerol-3-phosphate acyltransferase [Patescibacteria group bacterium]